MNTTKGFQTLVEHFRKNGWHFEAAEGRPILHASFTMKNGKFRLLAVVDEDDDLLQIFTFLPVVVPPEKRPAVAEVCIRVSHRLKLGNFELNFDDGELRLHTAATYPKGQLSDEAIRRAVSASLITTDVHFPAFMRAIYAGCSAREALQQAAPATLKTPEQQPPKEMQPPSRIAFN